MSLTSLPPRAGDRPRTGSFVPHLQLSQASPPPVREALQRWMATTLDGTRAGRSGISVPDSWALHLTVLPADGAVLMPPHGTEFVHLHADGSLHLAVHPDDQAVVLDAGWGERHPLYHPQRANALMVYAPRDEDEFALVQQVVAASYQYATGRVPEPAPAGR
ncbi:luciferase family protein [Streptomyces sp. NPDC017988]|uniref:luciferase domain-containing protein n=1 Tax=Streptomyces sp. NPDC017988 TaxID=3365025 RepID=UPI0037911E45